MDAHRFDALLRALHRAGSRRGALTAVSTRNPSRRALLPLLGGLLLARLVPAPEAQAKMKRRGCRGGKTKCAGRCVDLLSHPSHCGTCDSGCAGDQSCQGGQCVGGGGGSGCTVGCTSSVCGRAPAGCPLLPADNIWNTAIAGLPVAERSAAYIASIGRDTELHADFGAGLFDGGPIGIPFVVVPSSQPPVAVRFTGAGEESDPGPYPIPADAPIEGGSCATGDRHVLVVEEGSCTLYELFDASQQSDGSWQAFGGARFDLRANALRPDGWTSADAAGLPILPGLVRYEEITAGVIRHALRFTAQRTQEAYVWPARHEAGSTTNPDVPPLGQRFRLKADVDLSGFSATNQVILRALQTYGLFLADNGGDWFLSGVPDARWDNDDLRQLQDRIHGRDFEAVDTSTLINNPDSGQVA